MKRYILTVGLLGGFFAFTASDANAFVCARGLYRAGCAGPRGAIVGHRGYYGGGGFYRGGVYRGGVYRGGPIIGAVWPSFVDTDAPLLKVVPREEGHAPSRSRQCGRGGRAT